MADDRNRVFRDNESVGAQRGDTFAGVPVDQEIVESVATEYNLGADVLARTLRDVEQAPNLLEIGVLFTQFDPIPVRKDDNGHLHLLVESGQYWDVVANRLGLTKDGREAISLAHDRQIKKHHQYRGTGAGFVVPCPEFPSSVVPRIQTLVDHTDLTSRQATVYALTQDELTEPAVANILDLPEGVIESELVAVNCETSRVIQAAQILDTPNRSISRLEPDPTSDTWLGLDWSHWVNLSNREQLLEELPETPGVYRVRHTNISGLLYIGESGSEGGLRERVGLGLASDFDSGTCPQGGNHDATAPLWKLRESIGGSIEVSVANPAIAANKRHRRSLEAALVAVCRRESGRTPDVMLNRCPDLDSTAGGTSQTPDRRWNNQGYQVPDWKSWHTTTDSHWMGLDWTEPRPLSERDRVKEVSTCVYRVWEGQSGLSEWERVLTSIGTSETPTSRLFNLEKEYGSQAVFSLVEPAGVSPDNVERQRQFSEIRYDLIGAHYIATGQPPTDQY